MFDTNSILVPGLRAWLDRKLRSWAPRTLRRFRFLRREES